MAVNKAFYCGVVLAIADTVSVQGVPVPGPNPQTNSKEGQGQPLPRLSLGIKAEELYLTLKLYSSGLLVSGFILQWEIENLTSLKNMLQKTLYEIHIFQLLLETFFLLAKHNNTLAAGSKITRSTTYEITVVFNHCRSATTLKPPAWYCVCSDLTGTTGAFL